MTRLLPTLLLVAALVAATAPAALAAPTAGDVAAGRALARDLDRGTVRCGDLDAADLRALGAFAMQRWSGDYEAMAERMDDVLGSAAALRMREFMGRRHAGCGGAGAGMMMGGSGMGWMRDGAWRHMSARDWEDVREEWIGPRMMRAADNDGMGTLELVAFGLLAALGGVGLGLLVARGPWRRTPSAPAHP